MTTTIQPITQKVRNAQDLMVKLAPQMNDLLPRHMKPERMIKLLRAMLSRRPQLAECDDLTLIAAVVECASLGLEPESGLGHAWILPFKNSKTKKVDATLIIGYQGYIELAYRSGRIAAIWSEITHENDYLKLHYGTRHEIEHMPADGERGAMQGVYAVAELENGGKPFVYLTKKEVLKYRAMSPGAKGSTSPWNNPDQEPAMWRKTAIRRLQTFIPKSVEMAQAARLEDQADMGQPQAFKVIEAQVVAETRTDQLKERIEDSKKRAGKKPTDEELKKAGEDAKARSEEPAEAPEAESIPRHEQTAIILAERAGCDVADAWARLDRYSRTLFSKALNKLNDKTLDEVDKNIRSGDLTMEAPEQVAT